MPGIKTTHRPALEGVKPVGAFLALGLAMLLMPGCASSDQGAGGSVASDRGGGGDSEPAAAVQASRGFNIEDDPFYQLGFRLKWKGYAIVSDGRPLRSIDAFGDAVVTQDASNVVTVLDADTARIRWHDQVANDLSRHLANFRQGDELLSVSQTEVAFLDIRTGNLNERQRLSELANTRPVIASGVLVFGSSAGHIVGHNLSTGFQQWWIPMRSNIRSMPALVGGDVVVMAESGQGVIVEPDTGRINYRRIDIFDGLDNNPIASDDAVYLASRDQSLWAIDRYDASVLWRVRTQHPFSKQPVIYDGVLFIPTRDRGLIAHAARGGDLLWTAPDVPGEVVAVQNDRLLVRDGQQMRLVDPGSGDVIESVTLPRADLITFDKFVDGEMYLALPGGEVHRYGRRF